MLSEGSSLRLPTGRFTSSVLPRLACTQLRQVSQLFDTSRLCGAAARVGRVPASHCAPCSTTMAWRRTGILPRLARSAKPPRFAPRRPSAAKSAGLSSSQTRRCPQDAPMPGAATSDPDALVSLRDAALRPFLRRGAADPSDPMCARFGPVLTNVTWELLPGQHWAIVGDNGAANSSSQARAELPSCCKRQQPSCDRPGPPYPRLIFTLVLVFRGPPSQVPARPLWHSRCDGKRRCLVAGSITGRIARPSASAWFPLSASAGYTRGRKMRWPSESLPPTAGNSKGRLQAKLSVAWCGEL